MCVPILEARRVSLLGENRRKNPAITSSANAVSSMTTPRSDSTLWTTPPGDLTPHVTATSSISSSPMLLPTVVTVNNTVNTTSVNTTNTTSTTTTPTSAQTKLSLCKIKLKGHLQAQQQKRKAAQQLAAQEAAEAEGTSASASSTATSCPPAKIKKMTCASTLSGTRPTATVTPQQLKAHQQPQPQQSSQPTTPEGNGSVWSPSLYNGGGKLDSDTINYIHRIYCRECRMEEQRRQKENEAEGGAGAPTGQPGAGQPTSPQTQVEEVSLQQNKDKNKESLKRKLMLRRSVTELVDAGIYPPLKTPPAFAEQRKQLERAKTGDLLRHKIQHRPDRQALVQQHILEDTNVDPSLQDRQKHLKRARLQDSLSDRLANRPGPLELVERKILQTDPELKDAIEEGKLSFTKTSEVESAKVHLQHFVFDDDSNPSDGSPSPLQGSLAMQFEGLEGFLPMATSTPGIPGVSGQALTISSIPTAPDIAPLLAKMQASSSGQKLVFTSSMPNLSSLAAATHSTFTTTPATASVTSVMAPTFSKSANSSSVSSSSSPSSQNGHNSGGKVARLKKPKPKNAPKTKVIKFHEYKGPPNVVKTVPAAPSPTHVIEPPPLPNSCDPAYNILLQQQQLFLQWQLEFQQKNLPFIVPQSKLSPSSSESGLSQPATTPPAPSTTPAPLEIPGPIILSSPSPAPSNSSLTLAPSPQPPPVPPTPPQPQNNIPRPAKLEDMKVADLKAELKKRSLPVSGPKPMLIERLKQYSDQILASLNSPVSNASQRTTSSAESSPVVSQPSKLQAYQNMQNIINIQPVTPQSVISQSDDNSMVLGSPPCSPSNSTYTSDLNQSQGSITSGPLSPDMDLSIASPPTLTLTQQAVMKNHLNLSTGGIPMLIDQQMSASRPPSVAPMDLDLELGGSHTNLAAAVAAVSNTVSQNPSASTVFTAATVKSELSPLSNCVVPVVTTVPTPLYAASTPSPANQLLTTPSPSQVLCTTPTPPPPQPLTQHQQPAVATASQHTITMDQNQTLSQALAQAQSNGQLPRGIISVQLPNGQQVTLGQPVPQPAIITQDDILRQQQQQIEELRRQLQVSQLQLQEAQTKALQQQQQQQHQQSLQQLQQQASQTQQTQIKVLPSQTAQQLKFTIAQSPITAIGTSASIVTPSSITDAPHSISIPSAAQPTNTIPQPVLAQLQLAQGQTFSSIQVAPSTSAATTVADSKTALLNLLQAQTIPPQLNLGPTKVISFTATPTTQSLVFTAPAASVITTTASASTIITTTKKARANTVPANAVHKNSPTQTSSMPSSPVSHSKLHRSASNPFFSTLPMKDPPKYHEAMKNKQNVAVNGVDNNGPVTSSSSSSVSPLPPNAKNSTMDDVLEILIRSGDLPASITQDFPLTPKIEAEDIETLAKVTNGTNATVLNASSNGSLFTSAPKLFSTSVSSNILTSSIMTPVTTSTISNRSAPSPLSQQILMRHSPSPSLLLSRTTPSPRSTKSTPPPPLSLCATSSSTSIPNLPVNSITTTTDLTDFPANLADLPFITMDWSDSDTNMNTLDLSDVLGTPNMTLSNDSLGVSDFFTTPTSKTDTTQNGSVVDSEPNLNSVVAINDAADNAHNMNVDIPDWLDVIMPNTGLTPFSTSAPVSFSSDPILTPKPQEFLDLFNMDESDLYTPTDLTGATSFEKAMETAASNS